MFVHGNGKEYIEVMQEVHADRWPDLAIALEASRAGSLTAAASRLGIDQSTASRRLSALEASLGAPLFHRTPEGLRPTALGDQVLPLAEAMEKTVRDVERLAQGADAYVEGTVRLAAPEGLAIQVLAPRLMALNREHPKIRLELVTGFGVADLTRREADVAIRFVRPHRGDLVFKRVADVPLGAYVARSLLDRLGEIRSAEDLPWVGLDSSLGNFPEARWLAAHVKREPVFRANSYVVNFLAAKEGLGASLMTVASGESEPELVRVPLELPAAEPMALYVVTHRALRRVPRIDAVVAWAERAARETFA